MTRHTRLPLLVSLCLAAAAGCAEPRAPRLPRPPGVAPPAVEVRSDALLAKLASDGRPARAEATPGGLVVTFEPPLPMGKAEPFVMGFATQYGPFLGFGARTAQLETKAVPDEISLEDWHIQRDSGCRSVALRFQTSAQEPKTLQAVKRECDRYSAPPPPYGSRRLPSTANGSIELLAHCGSWGNGIIESYGGKALDKYGDVYAVRLMGPGPAASSVDGDNHTFLEYVRTVPPEEVERLLDDTELASHAAETKRTFGREESQCEAVSDTARGFDTVNVDLRKGEAATRARTWLHAVLGE